MSGNPSNRQPPLSHAEGLGVMGREGHPEVGSRLSKPPVKAGEKAARFKGIPTMELFHVLREAVAAREVDAILRFSSTGRYGSVPLLAIIDELIQREEAT